MHCRSCGNEVPAQGLFCLYCGTRLNKECPNCAEIVRLSANVCRFCSYEFTSRDMAEIEQLEQQRILRERAEQERIERERAEQNRLRTEESKRQEERKKEEYQRWHNPQEMTKWGISLLQCTKCSTLNSASMSKCRRCSTDLKNAREVRNPFL